MQDRWADHFFSFVWRFHAKQKMAWPQGIPMQKKEKAIWPCERNPPYKIKQSGHMRLKRDLVATGEAAHVVN